MPVKQNSRIFISTNNNAAHVNQAGAGWGDYDGMCGGLSSLWLKNMLSGKRDIMSKPDDGRAQLLQVKYRWDTSPGEQDILSLLQTAGLRGNALVKDAGVSFACTKMADSGGGFLIWNGPHFVAALVKSGRYYFYDCEEGLFLYSNASAWKTKIREMGYSQSSNENWDVWNVSAA